MSGAPREGALRDVEQSGGLGQGQLARAQKATLEQGPGLVVGAADGKSLAQNALLLRGSEISGVPASEMSATLSPASSFSQSLSTSFSPLWS